METLSWGRSVAGCGLHCLISLSTHGPLRRLHGRYDLPLEVPDEGRGLR